MAILNKSRDSVPGLELLQRAAELNHTEAMIKLCWARVFGYLPHKNESLLADFQKLADRGFPDAQMVCKIPLDKNKIA